MASERSQERIESVELKSWRNGLSNDLLLNIPGTGTWDEVWSRVESRLDEAKMGAVWQNVLLTLDLGMRSVSLEDLNWFVERLKTSYGLLTVAVVATDYITREAAKRLALNSYLMLPGGKSAEGLPSRNNALYIPGTVRSGQRIAHDGHLIVGGDVNAGAELIAAGDILVAGTLRGLAHAGSQGDESARISAGCMRPHQLRIAGQIARSPEEDSKSNAPRKPEMARIENGVIQVFPL